MANPFSVSLFVSLRNLIHRIEPLDWTVGGLVKPQRLLISFPSLKVVPPSLIGGTMIISFSPGMLQILKTARYWLSLKQPTSLTEGLCIEI